MHVLQPEYIIHGNLGLVTWAHDEYILVSLTNRVYFSLMNTWVKWVCSTICDLRSRTHEILANNEYHPIVCYM